MLKIQLVDRNEGMCEAWQKEFNNCKDVEIHCADIFSIKTDCIVSPANSFGFMNGGIDLYVENKYEIQKALQNKIKTLEFGELLVGQTIMVQTKDPLMSFVLVAPTMRVPMIIKDTVNVYLASKAIFQRLGTQIDVRSVTIPGLGAGVGQVPYQYVAKQMKQAYEEIWNNKPKFPASWDEAQKNHQLLYSRIYRDLQY